MVAGVATWSDLRKWEKQWIRDVKRHKVRPVRCPFCREQLKACWPRKGGVPPASRYQRFMAVMFYCNDCEAFVNPDWIQGRMTRSNAVDQMKLYGGRWRKLEKKRVKKPPPKGDIPRLLEKLRASDDKRYKARIRKQLRVLGHEGGSRKKPKETNTQS